MRIVSQNIDYAKSLAAHQALIEHLCSNLSADVVGLMECKFITLADLTPPGWTPVQDTTDEGTRGCAMLVRQGFMPGQVRHNLRTGSTPRGQRMLPRYILEATIPDHGRSREIKVAHYPPLRFRVLWPAFTKALADSLVAGDPRNAVICTDGNQFYRNIPKRPRLRRFHLAAHGEGIDAILTGPKVNVTRIAIDPTGKRNGWTDHVAVVCDLD